MASVRGGARGRGVALAAQGERAEGQESAVEDSPTCTGVGLPHSFIQRALPERLCASGAWAGWALGITDK